MYKKLTGKIDVALRPSAALALLLGAVHGGAFLIALSLPLALAWRAALVALVAASLYRALARHALRRTRNAIVAFALSEDDDTCVLQRHGSSDWKEGRLTDRWVNPWLTLLVVRCQGRRWPTRIVIAADAVAPETFRRLRVRLRLQTTRV